MARMEAEKAQRLLGDVAEDKVFWCHDGRVFRNIREMGEGFAAMTDETFAFHSNRDKGDFSNWVTEVIGDTKLARELAGSRTPVQAGRKVAERVEFLTARLA